MNPRDSRRPVVVFSQIDEVLIERESSRLDDAATLLGQATESDRCAIVLVSTGTRAELELVRQRLRNRHPFVCEHGSAVMVPQRYFEFPIPHARAIAGFDAVEFARGYPHVSDVLDDVTRRLDVEVQTFSQMSIAEVAREAGLGTMQASLAKVREYTERFRVLSDDMTASGRLVRALESAGLHCAPGEAFAYTGTFLDETVGVNTLAGLYRRAWGPVTTIGITETVPDRTLMDAVDLPILVADRAESVDVMDWAAGIANAIRQIGERERRPNVESPSKYGGLRMVRSRGAA
jgi:mannosyl-3-phosphoglycerate phosphatase